MVPWERVFSFEADAPRRVIHLEGAKGTLMRVYCPDAVYCESMRGRFFSFRNAFHRLAFPVEPPAQPGRSATKVVPWERVVGFRADAPRRVIHLESAKGTLMRVYCPDGETYERALGCIGERTAGARLAVTGRRTT